MLVAGVALAAFAFVAVRAFGNLGQPATPPDAEPEVAVAVAARELPLGSEYGAGNTATSGITLRELVDRWGVLPPAPVGN